VGSDAGDQLADGPVIVHDEHAVLHGCSFRFAARFSGCVRQAGT